jgi:hypothetical protein
MPAADKAKLDAATAAATPNTLMLLDAFGRAKVANPTLATEIANKGYVDGEAAKRALLAHTHDWADIASGVPATFPSTWATVSGKPLIFPSDWANVAGKPTTFAPSAHTHAWADITGEPTTYPPIIGTTSTTAKAGNYVPSWAEITSKPLTFPPTIGATATTAMAGNYVPDWSDLTGKPLTFAPIIGLTAATAKAGNYTPSWAEVTGKPATFSPAAHGHDWADISGVPATFPSTWATVSGKPTTFTPSAHTHSAADITSGTISLSRLPVVSTTADGLMQFEDKALFDTNTYLPVGSSIMRRHSSGSVHVITGTSDNDAANKKYVDDATALLDTATGLARGTQGGTLVRRNGDETFEAAYPTYSQHVANKAYVDNNLASKLASSAFAARITAGSVHTALISPDAGTLLACHNDGYVWSNTVYGKSVTTGASAWRAMWVNENGVFGYNLSSEKYKTDIRDYEVPLSVLESVRPKVFKYKEDVEEHGAAAGDHVNFIAEHLFDAGLTEYVSFDGKGHARENVETINEQLMVNALWSFARQQQAQIAELTAAIQSIQGAS